jgi:hypothetical protein
MPRGLISRTREDAMNRRELLVGMGAGALAVVLPAGAAAEQVGLEDINFGGMVSQLDMLPYVKTPRAARLLRQKITTMQLQTEEAGVREVSGVLFISARSQVSICKAVTDPGAQAAVEESMKAELGLALDLLAEKDVWRFGTFCSVEVKVPITDLQLPVFHSVGIYVDPKLSPGGVVDVEAVKAVLESYLLHTIPNIVFSSIRA